MVRILILLVLALPLVAQPLPPLTKFPSIGGYQPQQAYRSRVGLLAGQVVSELNGVRAEASRSGIPPIYKPALVRLIDQSITSAESLRNLALRSANPQELRNADAAFDAAFEQMSTQAARFGNYSPGMIEALARAQHADQQLHAVLHQGAVATPQNWGLDRVRRSSSLLENQAESLRDLSRDIPELDRAARAFSFRAARFDRVADTAAGVVQLRDDFSPVLAQWRNLSGAMSAARVPHSLRLQATRIDGTMHALSEMIPAPSGGWDWSTPLAPGPVAPPQPGFGFLTRGALVAGAGSGGGPRVRVFANAQGESSYDFFAYDANFQGGVRVAVADLTGDGVPDLVTAPGPGVAALIRVFDGRTMRLLTEFAAFEPQWTGGAFIAAADRTAAGAAWIAVGADAGGGPRVKVFDIAQGRELDSFFAFDPQFRGGVRVALGDVNGDGVPDVLTVPGPGHDPRVRVFDGRNRAVLSDFYAFDRTYTLGLTIATADLTRNGRAEMLVGTDAGQPAVVRIFDAVNGRRIGELQPYDNRFRGGVHVAAYDFDRDGTSDVVCSPGRDGNFLPLPVKIFSGVNSRPLGEFLPFGNDFRGGAWIASR